MSKIKKNGNHHLISGGMRSYTSPVPNIFPPPESMRPTLIGENYMITAGHPLVAKIASGYRGYGLPISDLISEGNIGMMHAVKRFEPEKGFRLATYAMWWIKASIQEYVLRSWSLVKIGTTAAQKKLFFNLRKIKTKISALDEGDLSPDQVTKIATELSVPEKEVISMNRRISGSDYSLNSPVSEDGQGEWQDWLEDETQNQEISFAESEEFLIKQNIMMSNLLSSSILTNRIR